MTLEKLKEDINPRLQWSCRRIAPLRSAQHKAQSSLEVDGSIKQGATRGSQRAQDDLLPAFDDRHALRFSCNDVA